MTEAEQIMKRCQIGTHNYNEANNLHADCYRVIGKLLAEKSMREVQRLGQEIEQDADSFCDANCVWTDHHPDCKLAQPEQEPMAIVAVDGVGQIQVGWITKPQHNDKLYTSPPQRTWVGLTEQEHTDIAVECGCMSADWVFYGAAVERKVKEKNT